MTFWNTFIQVTILVIFGLTGTIFAIVQWVKLSKKKKLDTTTKVYNKWSKWTHGHEEGWLVKPPLKTQDGLTRIEFYPTDLSKEERKKEKIDTEIIIAKNVQTMPMGTLSSYINIIEVYPNTADELIKQIPSLKVKLELFKPKKELENEINEIFSKKLPKMINSLNEEREKRKNKIGSLETYEEVKQEDKLTIFGKKLEDFKNKIEEIKNTFVEISSKDLFDYMVMFEQLKFELGKTFKSSHEVGLEALKSYNFGATGELEKKKLKEDYSEFFKYLTKSKEEKKD